MTLEEKIEEIVKHKLISINNARHDGIEQYETNLKELLK